MATSSSGGIPPPEDFPPLPIKHNQDPQSSKPREPPLAQYANFLKPKSATMPQPTVPPKPVVMIHGEPNITWKSSEVRSLVIQENLQFAIIGKFSYGKPDIMELRRTIHNQCGIKSECTIGVLDSRHILIRLTTLEDYVHLMSTAAFYVKARESFWQMRTLKWDPWFEPNVETTIGVAWISFPDLPPIFFAKEAIFSIATAVGKPLTVDMATRNQTRPSCAKVKIEVDLTAKLPQRIRITEEDDVTGLIKFKWIKVQYDYMPKYCKECCLQGHDEHNCWTIHPELYDAQMEAADQQKESEDPNVMQRTGGEERRILTSGKIVGPKINRQEWMVSRRNKYKRNKYGHIKGRIDVQDENPFEALNQEEEKKKQTINKEEINTKEWVQDTFGKPDGNQKEDKKRVSIEETQTKNQNKEETLHDDNKEVGIDIEQGEVERGDKEERSQDGAIMIYEESSEEIMPLAIMNDDPEENLEDVTTLPVRIDNHSDKNELAGDVKDKEDIVQNIENAAKGGDLSPKQKSRLKESHIKSKKQDEGELKATQASSRSKRMIIKNSKYQ